MARTWKDIKPNPAYTDRLPRWNKVHDVVDGEHAVKKRDNDTPGTYLRIINPSDVSEYNKKLNISYRTSAAFYKATGRTLNGLLGMMFLSAPVLPELPDIMSYVTTNFDGNGMGINQQVYGSSSQIIQVGRDGLLTDMPINESGEVITIADVENGKSPFTRRYKANNITDWNWQPVNGVMVLNLVILLEEVTKFTHNDMLERKTIRQYRILRLRETGYTQQVWKEDELTPEEEITVLDGTGKPWSEIPFEFVGSQDNNPVIDEAPLEGLADVNIQHYRNSADLEHSSFQLSNGTLHIADTVYRQQATKPNDKSEKTQTLGANSVILTGTQGKAEIVQPSPNTLADKLLTNKEQQMVALGAQLISEGGAAETAEAARIKASGDASVLQVISVNVSNGFTQSLKWHAQFLNVEFEGEYLLSKKFFEIKLTPQERQQIIVEVQSGVYPMRVAREQLQAGGVINSDEDLEKIQDEVETELVNAVDLSVEADSE